MHTLVVVFAAQGARASWLDCVTADLRRTAARSCGMESMQGASLAEWVTLLARPDAKKAMHKAFKEPLLRERVAWDVRSESMSGNALDGAGAAFCELLSCAACSAAFASRQALAVHMAVKHGQKMEFGKYIETTWCPCCLVMYASRIKCIDHLAEKGAMCRFSS